MRRLVVISLLALCAIGGCVTEGPARPERRKPRTIPEPPGLEARTLLLNATPFPVDADGDGFADTFTVSVFLFPPENRYPLPIFVEGTFEFTLLGEDDEVLAEWDFSGERVERAMVRPLTGPGYIFNLDINEVADDRIAQRNASLWCTFVPVEGDPVEVRGPTVVRIGRTGAQ